MKNIDLFKDEYIKQLLINHNDGAGDDQKNLVTSFDYEMLLKKVVDLIKANPDDTPKDLRRKLYEQSGIEEEIYKFIVDKKIAPSLSITYGTPLYQESISIGNRYGSDTIYDLASITKIFTGLSIMKLASEGLLDLNTKIRDILPEFVNIEDTTVYDLLTFKVPIMTLGRVDMASDRADAEKILQTAVVQHNFNGKNAYNDMGAMVLKYVIEKVSNMDYYSFIKEYFLDKVGMNSTFVKVPDDDLPRLAPTDNSISYRSNDQIIINGGYKFGMPHDPKARIMESDGPNLSGHAGLFSSTKDMGNLCVSLIKGTVLDPTYVFTLSENVTGGKHVLNSESVMNQYFGKMVYSKNPIQRQSEVKHYLSGRAFGGAGFTGNKLTVDPLNEIFAYFSCNRTKDRVVQIPASITRAQQIIAGARYIELPDGTFKLCGTDYVYDTDEIKGPAQELAMQYKFIEDYFGLTEIETKEHRL